jgi:ribosomal protein S18 acetylase RimI-like enzyme
MTVNEQDSNIKAMESNMLQKLKYVANHIDTMEVLTINSTQVVNCAMPSDTFNTAFGGDIDNETACKVMDYYKRKHYPMAWWVGPGSQNQDLEKILSSAGFVHDELDIGMVCDLKHAVLDRKQVEGLRIQACDTSQDFVDFGKVLASIFDPVDEHVKEFYQLLGKLNPESRKNMLMFVGYIDDMPVATSAVFLTDVAGIFDISTHPDYRNKGYGTALFQVAIEQAKALAFEKAVLQASPDGLGIYKNIGFKEVCEFNVWSNQQALAK